MLNVRMLGVSLIRNEVERGLHNIRSRLHLNHWQWASDFAISSDYCSHFRLANGQFRRLNMDSSVVQSVQKAGPLKPILCPGQCLLTKTTWVRCNNGRTIIPCYSRISIFPIHGEINFASLVMLPIWRAIVSSSITISGQIVVHRHHWLS